MTPQIGEGSAGRRERTCTGSSTVLGDRDGPVGTAFTTSLASPSMGHSPFIVVARPNLPVVPLTLLVPAVGVVAQRHAELTMGAAQAGIAAAVLDLRMDDPDGAHCLIASVWVGPQADEEETVFANTRRRIVALKLGAGGGPWHGHLTEIETPGESDLPRGRAHPARVIRRCGTVMTLPFPNRPTSPPHLSRSLAACCACTTPRRERYASSHCASPARSASTCAGPTVYGPPHIGHGRATLVYDVLRRYLESTGLEVTAGVERHRHRGQDHRARRARAAPVDRHHEQVRAIWFEAMAGINVKRPTDVPHATEYVDEMVAMIGVVARGGTRTQTEDGVYLSVETVEGYGLLAQQSARRHALPAAANAKCSAPTSSAIPPTSCCGSSPSPVSRRGRRRGAKVAPDGTANAWS